MENEFSGFTQVIEEGSDGVYLVADTRESAEASNVTTNFCSWLLDKHFVFDFEEIDSRMIREHFSTYIIDVLSLGKMLDGI